MACSARCVNAECHISRDCLGKFEAGSWRYTPKACPAASCFQIGIHYADVLEYLIGPIKSVMAALLSSYSRRNPTSPPDTGTSERRAVHTQRLLRIGFRVIT